MLNLKGPAVMILEICVMRIVKSAIIVDNNKSKYLNWKNKE